MALDEANADCLLAVGDLLAVASSSSPTIHIIRKSSREDDVTVEVICRLIGHTMGVTALASRLVHDDMELFSGSRDGSIKIWSLAEQKILFSVQMESKKRGAEVTTLHIGKWQNSERGEPMTFLFSGQLDKRVRVWDLYAKSMMFELNTGPEPVIPRRNVNQMVIHVANTLLGCVGLPVPPETPSKEPDPRGQGSNGKLQWFQFQEKE
jgi:WD40 repeat protein